LIVGVVQRAAADGLSPGRKHQPCNNVLQFVVILKTDSRGVEFHQFPPRGHILRPQL